MENIQANRVRARSFELVDDAGSIRALMSCESETVSLEFYGSDTIPRISIGIDSQRTAVLTSRDGQGHSRAIVAVHDDPDGRTVLNVRDGQERVRAELLLDEGGAVGIVLADEWGQPRTQMRVSPDGIASVAVYDDEGNASGITNEQEPEDEES